MRGLRLSGLLISCVSSAALVVAGALLCALVPWAPALIWPVAALFWLAMWIRR